MTEESPNGKGTAEQKMLHVHGQLVASLWSAWADGRSTADLDPVIYSRLSVASVTQVAAMTAVDLNMAEDQFIDICRANYRESLSRAPRFG
jgi:hypothetical protein